MDYINYYLLFWVCIIGLCLGSFFNVVILRSISGESIVFPPSKCPKCGKRLKPWHNIPVLSYIFLKGKCGFCKEKISFQYPLVELLTMIIFGACFLKFGIEIKTVFGMIICSALIIMTGTDIKEKMVNCYIPIGLALIGLVYNFFITGNIIGSVLGLVAGIVIFEAIAWSGKLFTDSRAFGEADTYVAAALGACFGLRGLLYALIYTLIVSALVIFPMFIYKQYKANNKSVCILTILFILSALVFKTLVQNWYSLGFLAVTGIWLVIKILKNLKDEKSHSYLPLVPMLAAGAICYLFI